MSTPEKPKTTFEQFRKASSTTLNKRQEDIRYWLFIDEIKFKTLIDLFKIQFKKQAIKPKTIRNKPFDETVILDIHALFSQENIKNFLGDSHIKENQGNKKIIISTKKLGIITIVNTKNAGANPAFSMHCLKSKTIYIYTEELEKQNVPVHFIKSFIRHELASMILENMLKLMSIPFIASHLSTQEKLRPLDEKEFEKAHKNFSLGLRIDTDIMSSFESIENLQETIHFLTFFANRMQKQKDLSATQERIKVLKEMLKKMTQEIFQNAQHDFLEKKFDDALSRLQKIKKQAFKSKKPFCFPYYAEAMYDMAKVYIEKKHYQSGLKCLQAIEQANTSTGYRAKYLLGKLHLFGIIQPSHEKAYYYFQKTLNQEINKVVKAKTAHTLGLLHMSGASKHFAKNPTKGIRFLRTAAEQKDCISTSEKAKYNLRNIFNNPSKNRTILYQSSNTDRELKSLHPKHNHSTDKDY